MKRSTRMLTVLLTVAMLFSCIPAMAEATETVIRETTPVYFFSSDDQRSMETVFFTENKDIPYISAEGIGQLLRAINHAFGDDDYNITDGFHTYAELEEEGKISIGDDVDPNTSVYVLERENGSFVMIDAESDMLWFSDKDLFFVSSYAVSGGDVVASDGINYLNEDHTETATKYFKRVNGSTFVRTGDVTTVALSDYDIYIEKVDDMIYLPVATVSDLILPVHMTFNGEALFITSSDMNDTVENADGETMLSLYNKPGERERSEDLAYFNYEELCLMLDQCYGLTAEHQINNGFQEYFAETGLGAQLSSTDSSDYTDGMYKLVEGYFGDLHSGIVRVTPYSGGNTVSISGTNSSVTLSETREREKRFEDAREAAGITSDGAILEGYSEIGDTAFITFDSFRNATLNYYDSSLWPDLKDLYMSDTFGLVIYSQSMIHRDNSPIKNVVIDLSCNGGGSLDACVYIASWVLGSAAVSIENVRTGAQYTTTYWSDTNMDGKCGYDDELGVDDLNVYCLISGNSFSCGNFLPALFKEDGRVTLVGQVSGGGSCVVRNTSTADGTIFQISDYLRLSIVKNGSFYGIDEGIEPDIPLRKCASYYDREALMEYLKTFL